MNIYEILIITQITSVITMFGGVYIGYKFPDWKLRISKGVVRD